MDISALRERRANALTVTELNKYIKDIVDRDHVLGAVTVSGEISNFIDHRSGHLYFSLKDADAQIKAVMFRSARSRLKFTPEDGMKVTVHGSVSLYSQTGSVQLYANTMAPDGIGALYKAYEQLKLKLSEEGLFDDDAKKPIPRYPSKIGVITSPTGAAVRDIINVTKRRYPLAEIYLYPSLVQGDGAEDNLIKALDYLDRSKLVDVIIIGRGGGSIEDLWAFNGERLARRIYSATTPIISAVGHETDFAICDFVADMRAPTPSAAAEISVPDIKEIALALDSTSDRIEKALLRVVERGRERFDRLRLSNVFKAPESIFEKRKDEISSLYQDAIAFLGDKIRDDRSKLNILCGKTDALSPLSVLTRGYSLISREGKLVRKISDVSVGDEVEIRVQDGKLSAKVEGKTEV